MKRITWRGLLCPDPTHGPLLDVEGRLFCPHSAHRGRPKSHPQGYAAPSRAWFSMDEAEGK